MVFNVYKIILTALLTVLINLNIYSAAKIEQQNNESEAEKLIELLQTKNTDTVEISNQIEKAKEIIRTQENNIFSISSDELKMTALGMCVIYNHPEVARMLINRQVDINEPFSNGYTPLMYAITMGNLEITQLLIYNNADIEAGNEAYKPLSLAIRYRIHKDREEIIKLLLDMGVQIKPVYFDYKLQLASMDMGFGETEDIMIWKLLKNEPSRRQALYQQASIDLGSEILKFQNLPQKIVQLACSYIEDHSLLKQASSLRSQKLVETIKEVNIPEILAKFISSYLIPIPDYIESVSYKIKK